MGNDYGAFNERVGYQNVPATGVKTAGTGIPTIALDPDDGDMDNTTLDLAIAATSEITGDQALNYGTVEIAAGAIGTGNCILTLGSGLWIGQVLEFKIAGAVTGFDLVVTITSVIGGQNVFNMDSASDGLLVRWNGVAWQVIAGRSVNSTGSTTVAGGIFAIPVTHRYVAKTTGGAEDLTIVDGLFDGQLLTIHLVADGGNGTLTPGTNSTSTGWATCVFVTVKDTITIQWVDPTIGWIVIGTTGTAAATYMVIT